jgi:hypothetical protein
LLQALDYFKSNVSKLVFFKGKKHTNALLSLKNSVVKWQTRLLAQGITVQLKCTANLKSTVSMLASYLTQKTDCDVVKRAFSKGNNSTVAVHS